MRKLFEKACCFAGPESIPEEQERRIIARINHVMDRLISKEIFQFYTGAATGFDLLVRCFPVRSMKKKIISPCFAMILQNLLM